ncbi:MAG: nitroreductase family deazaflavin-dependent oxidoreductase [Marmoricola sp.]|nr:nitroreductase family deazaflavin-dependent oxidoreductase [Marmoricola sp.]
MDQKPPNLDGEFTRRVIKLMSRVNVRLYQLTGGRVGGTWRVGAGWRNPVPICLVEHRGRRTGKLRTTPLVYLRDGDDVVVVASQAGRPQHPLWYRNLQADPDVTVQVRRDRLPMRARTAGTDERARLWPRLVDLYADYDSYQSWTDREIPVVVLEPR